MAKKLLCVVVLMLALVCAFAACANDDGGNHTHAYGEWEIIQDPTCYYEGLEMRYCSCGESESNTLPTTDEHYFLDLITKKEATCTEDGYVERKCSFCEKTCTNTLKASHSYVKGICSVCNQGIIDISLPPTPLSIDYKIGSKLLSTHEITSIRWELRYSTSTSIDIYLSGTKTYDKEDDTFDGGFLKYKIYDSEGFVIISSSENFPDLQVGEKFKDLRMVLYEELDPNESYTLVIEDYLS